MIPPAIPYDEELRLKNLQSYNILDTDEEVSFDELLQVAAQLSGCPTALISFVDKDRQWFKAKINLREEELSREASFCGHVIMQDEVMLVNDAKKDERFHDNPHVTGKLDIGFYAGAPIFSNSGHKLGSVCVIDNKPRTLSPGQVDGLKTISNQISKLLELRVANKALNETIRKNKKETKKNYLSYFLNNGLPQMVFEAATFKMLAVNEAALELYGYTRQEFLQLKPQAFKPNQYKEPLKKRLAKIKENIASNRFKSIHLTKLKKQVEVEIFINTFFENGKELKISTIKDISKQTGLEKKLSKGKKEQERQKLEAAMMLKEKENARYSLQENINQILASTKLFLNVAKISKATSNEMIDKSLENITLAMAEVKELYNSLALPGVSQNYFYHNLVELGLKYEIKKMFRLHYNAPENIVANSSTSFSLIKIIGFYLDKMPLLGKAKNVWLTVVQQENLLITIKDDGQKPFVKTALVQSFLKTLMAQVNLLSGTSSLLHHNGEGKTFIMELKLAKGN